MTPDLGGYAPRFTPGYSSVGDHYDLLLFQLQTPVPPRRTVRTRLVRTLPVTTPVRFQLDHYPFPVDAARHRLLLPVERDSGILLRGRFPGPSPVHLDAVMRTPYPPSTLYVNTRLKNYLCAAVITV